MKFSHAMIRDAFERSALKLSLVCMTVITLTLSIMFAVDLSKDPIVIERACESRMIRSSSSSQSREEVDMFIREAVSLRFNAIAEHDPASFMVQDLLIARIKEQEELLKNKVDQKIIVRSINLDHDHFLITADRLIAAGRARSAVPIVLTAKISSKSRSETNPYGLVLTSVEQIKQEPKNE